MDSDILKMLNKRLDRFDDRFEKIETKLDKIFSFDYKLAGGIIVMCFLVQIIASWWMSK